MKLHDRYSTPGWILLATLVSILGAPGCVSPEEEQMFQPAYEPLDLTEPGWQHSKPLLLVADCQIFNIHSMPVPDRNLSAQSMVPTAIRSPQLNLFATEVLRWILADQDTPTEGIVHLGDAQDLACDGEFARFVEVMMSADQPWVLAPGNHDCFYFGNFHPQRHDDWRSACHGAGEPLTKDRFVRKYVAALLHQQGPGFAALARSLGLEDRLDLPLEELAELLPDQHTWSTPLGGEGYLDRIEWSIDRERPWRSFILQMIDIGSGPDHIQGHAIVMDSCQYQERPVMLPNAWESYPMPLNTGLTGQMLSDQMRSIRAWMEELHDIDSSPVLMCHHPVAGWEAKTYANMFGLLEQFKKASVIVTAHTHDGHYETHSLGGDLQLVELNVGSTTDWPMEWRTFQVFLNRELRDGQDLYVQSRRYTLAEELRNRPGFFELGWEVPFGEIDDYRAFRQGVASKASIFDMYLGYHLKPPLFGPPNVKVREGSYDTETRFKIGLMNTYARLLRLFPTDAGDGIVSWPGGCASDEDVLARIDLMNKPGIPIEDRIALLVELEPFEIDRKSRDPLSGEVTDENRLRFMLSQAVWASRFGYTAGRGLLPEDELVRVKVPGGLAPSALSK